MKCQACPLETVSINSWVLCVYRHCQLKLQCPFLSFNINSSGWFLESIDKLYVVISCLCQGMYSMRLKKMLMHEGPSYWEKPRMKKMKAKDQGSAAASQDELKGMTPTIEFKEVSKVWLASRPFCLVNLLIYWLSCPIIWSLLLRSSYWNIIPFCCSLCPLSSQ